jgi:GT2 family glycosyltransferase
MMFGVPLEQHVAFLAERRRRDSIEARVRDAVRACAGHPAVLCYSIGNEIPAPIVRWHGRGRIERFLQRLYAAAKEEDPEGLVTYVNYPSTEYLRLGFLDLACFNVYLEQRDRMRAYLARLQNLADDRALLMAEVGLDSRRNGEEGQAAALDWQLRDCFAAGCAGVFAFAWTDEWHRGGHEVLDWEFGLTTRDRRPKPALAAVARAYKEVPLPPPRTRMSVSVVVCTYNGAKRLPECLAALARQTYPDYEVIVVNDGSTDATTETAARYGVRLIETRNRGLSAARNTGMEAAEGTIVAYIDDDASPSPHWLAHLVHGFETTAYAALGGPNIVPPRAGAVEQCVANAPGGPTHVLVSDTEAEHLPGCNLAVRKAALAEIGGFDTLFRVAGDDVDACWRLREAGHKLGFVPGAVVWHHRRGTLRGYFRQQRGYGKAEAMLERKWPQKYSPWGHVNWGGRLYGNGSAQHRGGWRWRIYYGAWGSGFFQSIYGPRRGLLESLPLMPEWYLAILTLGALSLSAVAWHPAIVALPLLAVAVGALLFDAGLGAARAMFPGRRRVPTLRLLTAGLYLLQPLARLWGRMTHGLTPLRRRGPGGLRLTAPVPRERAAWSEEWVSLEDRVCGVVEKLQAAGSVVHSGGDWDRWEIEVRGGVLGVARLRAMVEEHGEGKQLMKVRWWPRASRPGVLALLLPGILAPTALLDDPSSTAALAFGVAAALVALRLIYECARAQAAISHAFGAGGR